MRAINSHKTVMFFRTFLIIFTLLAVSVTTAYSLDLETARSKGLAGEVDDGYIAIPPGAGPDAQELVKTVNQERNSVYAEIAKKNGISVEATGQRTFEKRYPGFPAGTWVKMKGTWSQK
jgi:uncharacterized protein YdbL (DUF1318 family)